MNVFLIIYASPYPEGDGAREQVHYETARDAEHARVRFTRFYERVGITPPMILRIEQGTGVTQP